VASLDIVNLDLVRQVKPHTNGECFLVLNSGAQVKVSRSYRDVVARFVIEAAAGRLPRSCSCSLTAT
jgi:hypothetical protein